MKRIVPALIILLAILHQDFWWWNSIEPLVFGFIPIGLAYHVGVSIVAALFWAMAVKFCWPETVEVDDVPATGYTDAARGSEEPRR
jgi:hypothetical protein